LLLWSSLPQTRLVLVVLVPSLSLQHVHAEGDEGELRIGFTSFQTLLGIK
jgi:hypothetical protein